MSTASYTPLHPILFVFDFSNQNMVVPEYNLDQVASANDSCVSVRTIADVDGDVTVTLAETLPLEVNGVEVFGGAIAAPSRRVAVVTSHNEKLLETEVQGERATVRIVVDDEAHPSRIWIEAR